MAGTSWIYLLMVTLLLTSFRVKCEEEEKEDEDELEDEVEETEYKPEGTFNEKLDKDIDINMNLLKSKMRTGNFGGPNHGLELTHVNFNETIKKHKIMLMLFYIPNCEHCKDLLIILKHIAQVLKDNDPSVPVAKVDCVEQQPICKRYELASFPNLKIFRNGEAEYYDGPATREGIINVMKEISAPNYVPPPKVVLTLTKENFTRVTSQAEMMMVEFYSPTCEACKRLAPELEKAARELKERKRPIFIAKVNAIVETELAKEHNISEYPEMFIFKKGERSVYNGSKHRAPGIQNYIISHTGIASTLYKKLVDVKNFMTSNDDEPVILGVFDDENDPLMKLYNDANDDLRDAYEFGHTFSKDVKEMIGLAKSAIVVVHREYMISKYEKRYQLFTDPSGSVDDVQEFYTKHQIPLVGHMLSQTFKTKYAATRPLVIVFYDVSFGPKRRSLTQFWWNKVVEVARKYPNITFAVAKEDRFKTMIEDFGLTESGESVNVALYDEVDRKFAMYDENEDIEFSEESLTEFIEKHQKRQLRAIYKSQKLVIADLLKKPHEVQIVMGKSFDDIIFDETKEVLIEIYSRKCESCRAIEKHITRLAKEFENETDIIIAKIDGTANDVHPTYKPTGYPTIYYALPGLKHKPVAMEIKRDYESLKQFVIDNSSVLYKKRMVVELENKEKGKEEL